MTAARSVGIGVLVVLLTLSVVGANGIAAAQQTVLNGEFVKTTIDRTDGYDVLQAAVVDAASQQFEGEEQAEDLPIAPETIVKSAITENYLQSQTTANIDRFYGYLHGRRGELVLAVNLEPVKDNIVEAVEAEVTDMPLTELVSVVGAEESASVSAEGVTMDINLVATMAANRSSYRTARAEFREQVRSEVLDQIVTDTMESSTNDELLALVIEGYNPDAYTEAEKSTMVDERDSEIRAAIRQQVIDERNDELQAQIDQRLATTNAEIKDEIATSVERSAGDRDPALLNATSNLAAVGVDGLTTDMSYAEFATAVDDSKGELAAAVAGVVEDQLAGEVPDEVDLTADMDPQAMQLFASMKQAVGIADVLVFVLPLLAILLIAAIYYLTASIAVTAIGSGIALFVSGILGVGLAVVLPPRIRGAIPADLPAGMASLITGLVRRVFGLIQTQSIVLLVAGILALGIGLALWYGFIPTDTTET